MHYAIGALAATALAQVATAAAGSRTNMPEGIQGFNSGAFFKDNSAKKESDFEKEMQAAQKLHGSPGLFNSMRLYTNIQHETEDEPVSAFDAAVATNTTLLLGIWCSGTDSIDNELSTLKKYLSSDKGPALANLVVGLSVGSEDIFRQSEKGIRNKSGPGAGPKVIVDFIKHARDELKGTALAEIPVGHVDTWNAWGNKTNKAVLDAVDFVGVDIYPFFEDDLGNAFANVTEVWNYTLGVAEQAASAAKKPIWFTETGWPSSGQKFGEAEPAVESAASYWQQIGCKLLFGQHNVWWFTLEDTNPEDKQRFAVTDDLSTKPNFNLTCAPGSRAPVAINTEEEDEESAAAPYVRVSMAVVLSVAAAAAAAGLAV
ncbi:glucan 1-3-beta-glucosidase [Apiospora phragmitis]|uniref:Glucan 1-3-beta-glucosidase n=1 Tax=Apiospora phragmitis TaxID=2905665 RepID=A0ABR1VC70_9PEZI